MKGKKSLGNGDGTNSTFFFLEEEEEDEGVDTITKERQKGRICRWLGVVVIDRVKKNEEEEEEEAVCTCMVVRVVNERAIAV